MWKEERERESIVENNFFGNISGGFLKMLGGINYVSYLKKSISHSH